MQEQFLSLKEFQQRKNSDSVSVKGTLLGKGIKSENVVGGTVISHMNINPLRYQYTNESQKKQQINVVKKQGGENAKYGRQKEDLGGLLGAELKKTGKFLQGVEANSINMGNVWKAHLKQ